MSSLKFPFGNSSLSLISVLSCFSKLFLNTEITSTNGTFNAEFLIDFFTNLFFYSPLKNQ